MCGFVGCFVLPLFDVVVMVFVVFCVLWAFFFVGCWDVSSVDRGSGGFFFGFRVVCVLCLFIVALFLVSVALFYVWRVDIRSLPKLRFFVFFVVVFLVCVLGLWLFFGGGFFLWGFVVCSSSNIKSVPVGALVGQFGSIVLVSSIEWSCVR